MASLGCPSKRFGCEDTALRFLQEMNEICDAEWLYLVVDENPRHLQWGDDGLLWAAPKREKTAGGRHRAGGGDGARGRTGGRGRDRRSGGRQKTARRGGWGGAQG